MIDNRFNLEAKQIFTDISDLLSYQIASARLQKLTIITDGKEQEIRPFINVILRAPLGQVKTSILHEVAKFGKKENGPHRKIMNKITEPALVGSIDTKSHNFTVGFAWQNRNDISLFDEFDAGGYDFYSRKQTHDALLQLLEHGYYEKKVGIQTNSFVVVDGRNYCRAQDGLISLKVNTPSIFATMNRFDRMKSDFARALITRTIPYEYVMNIEELFQLINKGYRLELKHFETPKEITINDSMRYEISKFVKEELDVLQNEYSRKTSSSYLGKKTTLNEQFTLFENPTYNNQDYETQLKVQLYMRTVGDCFRIYAITNTLDRILFAKICKLKFNVQEKIGKVKQKIEP